MYNLIDIMIKQDVSGRIMTLEVQLFISPEKVGPLSMARSSMSMVVSAFNLDVFFWVSSTDALP